MAQVGGREVGGYDAVIIRAVTHTEGDGILGDVIYPVGVTAPTVEDIPAKGDCSERYLVKSRVCTLTRVDVITPGVRGTADDRQLVIARCSLSGNRQG